MGLSQGINNESPKVAAAWAFLNKMLQSRGLRGFTVGADGLPPPLQVVSTVSLLLREADSRPDLHTPGKCTAGNLHADVPVSIATNKKESQDSVATTPGSDSRPEGSVGEELLLRQIDLLNRQNSALEEKILAMETCKGATTQRLTSTMEGTAISEITLSPRFSVEEASCPTVSNCTATKSTGERGNGYQTSGQDALLSAVPGQAKRVPSPCAGSADAYVAELDCLLQQLQTERGILHKQQGMGDRSEDDAAAAASPVGSTEDLLEEEDDDDAEDGGLCDSIVLQRCLRRCCAIVFRTGCGFLPEAQSSAGPDDIPAVLEHWVSELKRLAGLEDIVSEVSSLLDQQDPGNSTRGAVVLGRSEILSHLRQLVNLAEEAKAAGGVIAMARMAEGAGGPSTLPMELIKHFQLMFDCPAFGGVLACMNKVHIDLQAARNFKKSIASVMGCDDDEPQWSEATMAAIIQDLITRYWDSKDSRV